MKKMKKQMISPTFHEHAQHRALDALETHPQIRMIQPVATGAEAIDGRGAASKVF